MLVKMHKQTFGDSTSVDLAISKSPCQPLESSEREKVMNNLTRMCWCVSLLLRLLYPHDAPAQGKSTIVIEASGAHQIKLLMVGLP